MSEQCTWKSKECDRCDEEAIHPLVAEDGLVWANLCATHEEKFHEYVMSGIPKNLLGSWIAASGGPEALIKRM